MKITLIIIATSLLVSSTAMPQKLDYYPEQKFNVSDEDYAYGITVLKETYQAVKKDKGVFNYADYWNLAIALSALKEDVHIVRDYLFKSRELNSKKFSIVFLELGSDKEKWDGYLSTKEFEVLQEKCFRTLESNDFVKNANNDILVNESSIHLNKSLIKLIRKISKDDKKYRFTGNKNIKEQRKLDDLNLILIDSLFTEYRTYIGKSLVGETLSYVMWLVIQHSNIYAMERYLPIVAQAVKEGELELIPLKMLVDRIYAIKYDYQIFGSQKGVNMATDKIIEEVKTKYHLIGNNNIKDKSLFVLKKKSSNINQDTSKKVKLYKRFN